MKDEIWKLVFDVHVNLFLTHITVLTYTKILILRTCACTTKLSSYLYFKKASTKN